jgi:hypothetical protein
LEQEILLVIRAQIEEMMIMMNTVKNLKAAMDMMINMNQDMNQSTRHQIIDLMLQEIMTSIIADMIISTETEITMINMIVKTVKIDTKETIDNNDKINILVLANLINKVNTNMNSQVNINVNQMLQELKETQTNTITGMKDEATINSQEMTKRIFHIMTFVLFSTIDHISNFLLYC